MTEETKHTPVTAPLVESEKHMTNKTQSWTAHPVYHPSYGGNYEICAGSWVIARDVEPQYAPLIEAAPDLLEALEMLRAEVNKQPASGPGMGQMLATLYIVDAAIAKAKGTQETSND